MSRSCAATARHPSAHITQTVVECRMSQFTSASLLLEFGLTRLSLGGPDRKGDRRAGGNRVLRLALERVLALGCEGDRFAGRSASDQHGADIALGRDGL